SDARRMFETTQGIEAVVGRVGDSLAELTRLNEAIKGEAAENLRYCAGTIEELNGLENGLTLSSKSLSSGNGQVAETHKKLAQLVDKIGNSDIPTDDTPYLEAARAMRAKVTDVFEAAVASRTITLGELFSEDYAEIPGTNPKQYLAKF